MKSCNNIEGARSFRLRYISPWLSSRCPNNTRCSSLECITLLPARISHIILSRTTAFLDLIWYTYIHGPLDSRTFSAKSDFRLVTLKCRPAGASETFPRKGIPKFMSVSSATFIPSMSQVFCFIICDFVEVHLTENSCSFLLTRVFSLEFIACHFIFIFSTFSSFAWHLFVTFQRAHIALWTNRPCGSSFLQCFAKG